MKTLIVCGGDLSAEDMLLFRPLSDQADFIIAADKGCDILLETGIIPDLAVGDFDSSRVPEKTRKELRTIVYPAEKDYSDTEAALYEAIRAGSRCIALLGAGGGRLDHFLANLYDLLIPLKAGTAAFIADRQNYIFLAGGSFCISGKEDFWEICPEEGAESFRLPKLGKCDRRYLSLLPLDRETLKVSIDGCRYSGGSILLSKEKASYGISNELTHPEAHISFHGGILTVILSRDRRS